MTLGTPPPRGTCWCREQGCGEQGCWERVPWGGPASGCSSRLCSQLSLCPGLRLGSCGAPPHCPLREGRETGLPAAGAQLRTLGGLEGLRGFPRGARAASLLPAGGLRGACPLPSQGLPGLPGPGAWLRSQAWAPGDQLPGKEKMSCVQLPWWGGRQLGTCTRDTCRRDSCSPALCSLTPQLRA